MYVCRPHMTLNRDGEGLSISSSVGSSSEPQVGWEDAYLYSILKLLDYHLQHFGFVSYGCLHLSENVEKSQHLSWKTERVWQSTDRKCVRCSAFFSFNHQSTHLIRQCIWSYRSKLCCLLQLYVSHFKWFLSSLQTDTLSPREVSGFCRFMNVKYPSWYLNIVCTSQHYFRQQLPISRQNRSLFK